MRNGSQLQIVPALTVTNYVNQDDEIALLAYKPLTAELAFGLRVELVPTVAPKLYEVATYAGIATRGTVKTAVTCSATRSGAGVLKPQVGLDPFELLVACYRDEITGIPLFSYKVKNAPSRKIVTDFQEFRDQSDNSFLSSFQVTQSSFDKEALQLVLDDGQGGADIVAKLEARGVRVPTNQATADPAIFGIWAGTYERFDAPRQFKSDVTCYAF